MSALAQSLSASPSLLGSVSVQSVTLNPFAHVVVDDALPAPTYAALAQGFPAQEAFLGNVASVPENHAVRLELRNALAAGVATPEWQAFFDYHQSDLFWREIVRVFGPHLRQAHPDLEDKVGRPMEQWRTRLRGETRDADVVMNCQYVINTPLRQTSSVKPAHIDRADKIFAGLFYMRRPDDLSEGASLELYRHRRAPAFDKHETPWSAVEHVGGIAFAANRFIGFVNSVDSVHAVAPRSPSPVPRRYINIIAEMPERAFSPPQLGKLRRFYYRRFQRPARRTIGRED